MEKCICIQYLFDNLILPCKLNIIKDEAGKISKINYEKVTKSKYGINSIQSFIDNFPNCRKLFKDEEDIIDCEEKIELDSTLNAYLKDLKNLLKNEIIMERYSKEEFDTIMFELENYILYKLYEKLFPIKYTKEDNFFYNKCLRLNFITPENVIKDKKLINKNLLDIAINYIKEMDKRKTPLDKINSFTKAIDIIKNSIAFNSGKTDLGLDDTLSFIIYIILKAQCRNIYTTLNYCNTYISPELGKKYYGNVLAQFTMVIKIIKDMKYTDLINVTQEQFGKD
jgi:hypothetical protein